MVKISKETINVPGVGEFIVEVEYAVRKKSFIIKLPDKVKETIGKAMVAAETFDDAKDQFSESIKEYNNAKTIERKVIVYHFRATAWVMDEEERRCIFREDEVSFAKGTALDLFYEVLVEKTLFNRKSYHYLNGNYAYGDNEGFQVMDWTEQREDFFKMLNKGLQHTIMKAHAFFNANNDDIMKFIDSGGKLLLPEAKE